MLAPPRPSPAVVSKATWLARVPQFAPPRTLHADSMHPPALVDTYFGEALTTLVIEFDSQPTNRAQQNGLGPCSQARSKSFPAGTVGRAWFSSHGRL